MYYKIDKKTNNIWSNIKINYYNIVENTRFLFCESSLAVALLHFISIQYKYTYGYILSVMLVIQVD